MSRAAVLLAGLTAGCMRPDAAFVRAERATYDAVAPEYLQYVNGDPQLDGPDRERRIRTIATWDVSIRRQEEAGAEHP